PRNVLHRHAAGRDREDANVAGARGRVDEAVEPDARRREPDLVALERPAEAEDAREVGCDLLLRARSVDEQDVPPVVVERRMLDDGDLVARTRDARVAQPTR